MQRLRTVARVAFVGFAASMLVAVSLYPGGDQLGGREHGFSLARNFVCDLAADASVDGRANPAAPWARAAMACFVAGLAVFWIRKLRDAGRACDRWAARLGIAGAVGAVGLPMGRPHLAGVDLHPFLVLGATLPELVAVALASAAAWRAGRRAESILGVVALATAGATALLYAASLAAGASSVALPVAQKAAIVAALAWLLVA